uniref:Uncharacterized protein n=1 Tax=Amphimedon queenslandica TaxID=400682 RepID=A0A1X7T734_AMPQE
YQILFWGVFPYKAALDPNCSALLGRRNKEVVPHFIYNLQYTISVMSQCCNGHKTVDVLALE